MPPRFQQRGNWASAIVAGLVCREACSFRVLVISLVARGNRDLTVSSVKWTVTSINTEHQQYRNARCFAVNRAHNFS